MNQNHYVLLSKVARATVSRAQERPDPHEVLSLSAESERLLDRPWEAKGSWTKSCSNLGFSVGSGAIERLACTGST